MNAASIHIQLAAELPVYAPGDLLTGRFFVENPGQENVRAAELSVLWYTAGKGEEDLAVHFFERMGLERRGLERRGAEEASRLDLRTPRPFEVRLPLSPISYDGAIVKVCWSVRVRVFLSRGQEVVAEMPFRLGQVAVAG